MTRSRQRKKMRQRALALEAKEAAAAAGREGQGPLTVLADRGHERQDMQLVDRAVREDWPVNGARKETIVKRLVGIVKRGEGKNEPEQDDRAIRAAGVLVRADGANIARHRPTGGSGSQRIPPAVTPVTITNNVSAAASAETKIENLTVQGVLDGMANDPTYIDFLRSREAGGNASLVGAHGEPRPVADAETPGVD